MKLFFQTKIMEGFDEAGVFFSDNFGGEAQQDGNQINMQAVKKKYKEFLRTFNEDNFFYKYRYVCLVMIA